MIRELMAALAFLTRIPISPKLPFTAAEIGRSTRWFPLAGLAIGCVYATTEALTAPLFPPAMAALIIVLVEAVLTGAIHLDGLADMADGFGGGETRKDVLRIMRDHAIGSYGTVALILFIGFKVTAIMALISASAAGPYLVAAPAIGRWSAVVISSLQPYARQSEEEGRSQEGGVSEHVGRRALLISTLLVIAILCLLEWARWAGWDRWAGIVAARGRSSRHLGWRRTATAALAALRATRSEQMSKSTK